DQICDRFEAALKAGRQPRIEDYLTSRPKAEQAALLRELLLVEVEYRQIRQEQPAPEEYQQRFAECAELIRAAFHEMTGPERNPVEALAEEFLDRCRRGERPSLSEYTARHPEWADKIRSLFPLLLDMEAARPDPHEDEAPEANDLVNWEQRLNIGDCRGGM